MSTTGTTTGADGPSDAAPRRRPPAVAGTFYPGRSDALARTIDADLAAADPPAPGSPCPKALIVPHAGYVYSGPIAASAYVHLRPFGDVIRRVVLLGPAHRVAVASMAVSTVDAWETPLGLVPIDTAGRAALAGLPGIELDDHPHAPEHALEVQLPFLQRVLADGWTLLPIVVGQASHRDVAAALDAVWGGDETLVVVSSDLSHYLTDRKAKKVDRNTAAAIVEGRFADIGPYDACGAYPLRGLLTAAESRGLHIELLDLRTSADTAGDPSRVVGYGSFALLADPASMATPPGTTPSAQVGAAQVGSAPTPEALVVPEVDPSALDDGDRQVLLRAAEEAIRAALEGRAPIPPTTDELSPALRRPGAAFVTLRHHGELRGCIGSIEPRRLLAADVAANARSAALDDPRFEPLHLDELPETEIHLAVLTPTEPLDVDSLDELARVVRPGVDGLLVEAGRNRGTFLPSVWEQLPAVDDFLTQLWRKAGLKPGAWPKGIRVSRYQVDEFVRPPER